MRVESGGQVLEELVTVPDLLSIPVTMEEAMVWMKLKLRRKFRDFNGGAGTNNIENIRSVIEQDHEV